MAEFDPDRVSRAVGAALTGPAGVALVVNVFGGLPGVTRSAAKRGLFSSQPERVQIGDWRYEVTRDGRLCAAHLVNGIVIGEDILAADAVGPHVARAVGQVAARYGAAVMPHIDAALEALDSAGGGAF